MSEATNNSVDYDLFSEMQTQGDTEVQSRTLASKPEISFIQKCIHPPSALPGYAGIPTNDARSQTCLEWRRMNIMNTPRIYDYSLPSPAVRNVIAADLNQFDYCYLHLNGARVMSVPFIFNQSSGSMGQDYANVQTINQYDWKNWCTDANLFRVVYKSSTHTLNATMFNNTGLVVGSQFNPSILFSGTIGEFAECKPAHFRRFVQQFHLSGQYPVTTDPIEKTQFAGIPKHIRDDVIDLCGLKPGTSIALDPNVLIQVLNLSNVNTGSPLDLTPTNDSILQMSLRSYGGKASEGAFSVQRLNTIAPKWNVATNSVTAVGAPYQGLYNCYTYTVSNAGSEHFVALSENAAAGTTGENLVPLADTLWTSDMTMSWVKFSGLSLNSQSSVSTQLLALKQYIGIEVQPSPVSAWAAMMRLGPKPDLQSMQALMDAFYELKDVLPARYNFWGTLGSIAAQGLKTFGSSILDSLMKSGGSSPNKKSKAGKSEKPVKEIRDVDNKTDALNRKVDLLLKEFNIILGQRAVPAEHGPSQAREPRPKSIRANKQRRSNSAPARGIVLPPAPPNQNAMAPPKKQRGKRRRN